MSQRMRPWKSVAPPGVNGSTSRTGFAGHAETSWARAHPATPSAATHLRTCLLRKRVKYRTRAGPPPTSLSARRVGALPLRALAQRKMFVIGYLAPIVPPDPRLDAFKQGMRDL